MKIFVPAFGRVNTKNRDGGAVRFINIAKRLQDNKTEITMLTSEREARLMREEGVVADYYTVPEWIKSERDTTINVLLVYFVRLIQSLIYRVDRRFDVIYSASDFIADVVSGVFAKRRNPDAKFVVCIFLLAPNPFVGYRNVWRKGRKVIPSFRGMMFFSLQKMVFFLCNKYADSIFVLNEMDKEALRKVKFYNRVNVVNMGVSIDEIADIKTLDNVMYDGVFLGRIHPQKGIDDLIKIWGIVCNKKKSAKLAIIGGGDESSFKQLNAQIEMLGLKNNIDILGFRSGADKYSLLKSAKIFLMPSYYESWGMVVVEAMACGLPVIAYDLPFFKLIFSGGMVRVGIGMFNDFASAILNLMEDNSFYFKLKNEAGIVAKKYDWNGIVEQEKQLLSDTNRLYEFNVV